MGHDLWKLFEPRGRYVVQQSFKSLSDTFEKGEVLTFDAYAQSIYHDMLGYFFTDERGRERRWDFPWAQFDQMKANLHLWFMPEEPA